ncbi:vacuolar protein-sorting-associated protein, partial [Verticillium alfalfae VaMs.102]
MAQPKPPFVFPREYSFPPFFTRQTNLTTHHAQLEKWSALILAYTQHHRIFKLTPPSAASSSAAAADPSLLPAAATANTTHHNTDDLFHNKTLNRRLAPADAREVLDAMRRDGRAATVARDGDAVWVYWRTPEEWAALVEAWVDDTAQKGVVVTLYELTEGD